MAIEKLLMEVSKKCEIFSNPLRSLIASFLIVKKEVSWSELKRDLEEIMGNINPNTLSFHIGKLIDAGFLDKAGTKEQPRYKIFEEKIPEIEVTIGKNLIEKIGEEFSK